MKYFLRQKPPNENVNIIKIPLEEDNVRVGRKTVSCLSHYPQISREHAEFHKTTSGALFVRDLNSSNGLYVNGRRVGTSLYELHVGDIIGFGVPFLHDENGFICILCSESDPSIVKHEVIEISDEEERCSNSHGPSNLVAQTLIDENKIAFPLSKSEFRQDVTQISNGTSDIQTHRVSDTSLNLKPCNLVFCTNSVIKNEKPEQNFEVRNTVRHASTSQTHSSVWSYPSVEDLPIAVCHIHLVRCDSEDFEWPTDVRNPYKKHKHEDLQKDSSPLILKRRHARKLSSDSDSNDKTTSELSAHNNQNTSQYNASENCILQSSFKKRKISENGFPFPAEEQFDVNQSNFPSTDLESNLENRLVKSIRMTVHQENVHKPLKSVDNEISYSQAEEVIIISDDESYLDFNSSQNYVRIKEEPPDINEDIDNQEELYKEIFYDGSEAMLSSSRFETSIHNEVSTPESVETIRKFVKDTEQENRKVTEVTNEADHCDLEMQCSEGSDVDDNFESEIHVTIENSSKVCPASEVKCNNDGSLDSKANKSISIKKSVGRTLLTEPKPMQQRPRKTRGREEGFKEQDKYHKSNKSIPVKNVKKTQVSKKSNKTTSVKVQKNISSTKQEVIKIGDTSSNLKNFKIPRKLSTNDNIDPKTKTQCKNESATNKLISYDSKKKAASVKKRPEKFGSRMAFLTDAIELKPSKNKKSHEKKNLPDQLKSSKNTSSNEKQNNKTNLHLLNSDTKHSVKFNINPAISDEKLSNKSNFHSSSSDMKHSDKFNFHCTNSDAKQSNNFHFHLTSSGEKQSDKSNFHATNSDGKQSDKSNIPPINSYRNLQSNKLNFLPTSSLQQRHVVSGTQSTSRFQQISNSATHTLNIRDPRINKHNSMFVQDVVKSKLSEVSDNSASAPFVKMTDLKRPSAEKTKPTSSADFTGREKSQLNSHVIIKNLINLKCVWLQEQAKIKLPPSQVSKGVADLPLYFKSYSDYVNLFTPMIMLEIWDCMFNESKDVFKSKKAVNKFYFSIVSYASRSDCIELKCESIVAEKFSYSPKEGSIVSLELKEGSNINPLFGYIFRHKTDKFNPKFVQSSVWQNLPKEWIADATHWTFHVYVKKREMPFRLGSLMKANGICYIRSKLRLADALGNLKNSPLAQDIILPRQETFFINYAAAEPTREYTTGQMKVISGIHAVIEKSHLEPKIILVQGPPGTGKTHTIIGLLERLVQNGNSVMKILMVAPSNAAIDEIGCRLIELNQLAEVRGGKLKFVRVGLEKQVHNKMLPYFLEQRVKDAHRQSLSKESDWKNKKLQDLKKEISQFDKNHLSKEKLKCLREEYHALKEQIQFKKLDYHAEISIKEKILKESHIVLSTLNSCGLPILLRTFKLNSNMQFSCCIIDEATQCTELEVLQPLMFGINKLILVGDHMQLPATVTSKLATDHGFERSMFERFHLFFEKFYRKSPVYTLTEQFRMHSKICAFPSNYFYHKKLVTEPITDIKYNLFPLNHYVILDVLNSQETTDSSSKVNHTEATVIANLCKCLLEVLGGASSIGIITPYQGQRSLYVETLHQNPNYRDIEVNTIDGFQGREKDIIIFSCVRANSQSGGIGFLVSGNRLNVAITRAKKCLLICCHAGSLNMYPDWKALFDDAKERTSYVVVPSSGYLPTIFEKHIKKQKA